MLKRYVFINFFLFKIFLVPVRTTTPNNRLPLPQARLPGVQPQSRQPVAIAPQTTQQIRTTTSAPRLSPSLNPSLNPLQRCKQIQSDPSLAAEVLIRERLVFATEGLNFKKN